MSLQEGMKLLRSETGYTQMELARELGIGFATLNRWENEKTRPNHIGSQKLMEFAWEHKVSSACMEYLHASLYSPRARMKKTARHVQETVKKLKFEDMERLTADQLKMTIEHISIGVIALRKYRQGEEPLSEKASKGMNVFYFNESLVHQLGYSRQEIYDMFAGDIYCFQESDEIENLHQMIRQVMDGKIPFQEAQMDLRIRRKDGAPAWASIRILSRMEYTFGTELFITVEDITRRMEAQAKYQAELDYRKQILKKSMGWAYCNLTNNQVIQLDQKHLETYLENSCQTTYVSVDQLTQMVSEHMEDQKDRERFFHHFTRTQIMEDYKKGKNSMSMSYYDSHEKRWAEISYYVILNPWNHHLEAYLYTRDIQMEKIARSVIDTIAAKMFDYIGRIYVEDGKIQCFKQENQQLLIPDYVEGDRLKIVMDRLEEKEFASFFCTLKDTKGREQNKKVMFRYLSPARHMIMVAISDVEKLSVFSENNIEK